MAAPFTPTIYAVDFGTSNSLLTAAGPGATCPPIPLDDVAADPTILRSLLFFDGGERFSCGSKAIGDFVANGMQGRFIRSMKKYLPDRSFAGTQIGRRVMTIEDLIGRFLKAMRDAANKHFNADIDRVVLGRPAKFSADPDCEKLAEERLERAAMRAGFREVHLCPEPVAAARDVHLDINTDTIALVADFGGGTSDFTIVHLRRQGFRPSDVIALGGVSVAGDALDGSIMRHSVARHFGAEVTYRVPMGANTLKMPLSIVEKLCSPADMTALQHRDILSFLRDVRGWSLGPEDRKRMDQLLCLVEDSLAFRVFEAIEHSKCELSAATATELQFEYPTIQIREPITRGAFEAASRRAVDAIIRALDETVASAGVSFEDIDVVCCTGGTAKVPRIAQAITQRFGAEKVRQLRSFHSVVQGLAEHARGIASA
jgi:hypothetical chaperone protein